VEAAEAEAEIEVEVGEAEEVDEVETEGVAVAVLVVEAAAGVAVDVVVVEVVDGGRAVETKSSDKMMMAAAADRAESATGMDRGYSRMLLVVGVGMISQMD
jgi:hypothetical protein